MSITTLNSQSRLPRLLGEVASFADEILIGVDDSSTDDTFEIARDGADHVYRFCHTGESWPARMLPLERTRCDWLLVLDDDEGVDAAFPEVLAESIADGRHNSWSFQRKWIVNLDPFEYLCERPWFPNFSLRLFRADPQLVWKPSKAHSGIRVMGLNGKQSRSAILHYEPLIVDAVAREEKLRLYRARDSSPESEAQYLAPDGARLRKRVEVGPLKAPRRRPRSKRRARVEGGVIDLDARPRLPPWDADISVEMPARARPGQLLHPKATALNTGALAWFPHAGPTDWPTLNLSYRVLNAAGEIVDAEGARTAMPHVVEVGGTAQFVCCINAPLAPGDYTFEWQLVSEGEAWFSDCGASPERKPLRIEGRLAPGTHVDGWMTEPELEWLHSVAQQMESIVEIGSHLGRSSFALLSGCGGSVTCIDPWAAPGTRRKFMANVGHFPNLRALTAASPAATAEVDERVDLVFIDGCHDYEAVAADIDAWLPVATKLICGHGYGGPGHPGVTRAVDERFGDRARIVAGTIWAVEL